MLFFMNSSSLELATCTYGHSLRPLARYIRLIHRFESSDSYSQSCSHCEPEVVSPDSHHHLPLALVCYSVFSPASSDYSFKLRISYAPGAMSGAGAPIKLRINLGAGSSTTHGLEAGHAAPCEVLRRSRLIAPCEILVFARFPVH